MKLPVDYNQISYSERRNVRNEYVRLQGGNCHHCGTPLSGLPSSDIRTKYIRRELFPVGFFRWPVHLHHSHDTGLTIGAVHAVCNAVLWQYHGE